MSFHERRKKLKETYRPRQEWWSRVFASPVAYFLLHLIADWAFISPNFLTILSFSLVLIASALIVINPPLFLLISGITLQIAYILDCMDGQLARYRGISSEFGAFLDKCLDYIKFPFVIAAMTHNAFSTSGDVLIIMIGFSCLFFICFTPYLREMTHNDFSITSWSILSKPTFLERNMRFFLFEEAQWYLIVSVCLILKRTDMALWFLFYSQGIIAFIQLFRVIVILTKRRPSS